MVGSECLLCLVVYSNLLYSTLLDSTRSTRLYSTVRYGTWNGIEQEGWSK